MALDPKSTADFSRELAFDAVSAFHCDLGAWLICPSVSTTACTKPENYGLGPQANRHAHLLGWFPGTLEPSRVRPCMCIATASLQWLPQQLLINNLNYQTSKNGNVRLYSLSTPTICYTPTEHIATSHVTSNQDTVRRMYSPALGTTRIEAALALKNCKTSENRFHTFFMK